MSTLEAGLVGSVRVVGAWRFVSSVSHTADGNENRRSRPGATGYLMCTDDGHMAFLNMRSLPPGFTSGTRKEGHQRRNSGLRPDQRRAAQRPGKITA